MSQAEVWVIGTANRYSTASDGRYILHLVRPDNNHKLKLKIKLPSGKIVDKEISDLDAEPTAATTSPQTSNLYDLNLSERDIKGE